MAEKFRVIIFDDESGSVRYEKFDDIIGGDLLTKEGIYPMESVKRFFNETGSTIDYYVHLDLPAKIEASNLVKLRRSQAIGNLFNFETKKQFDIMSLMPWAVIIALIIFM